MRNLRKVCHEHLVGDGFSEYDRQVVLRLLELLRVQDALHRHVMALLVWHLNTDSALARYRRNDTHAESRKAQRDVCLQTANLGDADTFSRSDLVERDGRTDSCLYFADVDAETLQHLDNLLVVRLDFVHINVWLASVLVLCEQVECRVLVSCERFKRIDRRVYCVVSKVAALGLLVLSDLNCQFVVACLHWIYVRCSRCNGRSLRLADLLLSEVRELRKVDDWCRFSRLCRVFLRIGSVAACCNRCGVSILYACCLAVVIVQFVCNNLRRLTRD